jgi:hypothetical protein
LTGLPVNANQLPPIHPLCVPQHPAGSFLERAFSPLDRVLARHFGDCCGYTNDCSKLPEICGSLMTPMNRAFYLHDRALASANVSAFNLWDADVIQAHLRLSQDKSVPMGFQLLFRGLGEVGLRLNFLRTEIMSIPPPPWAGILP